MTNIITINPEYADYKRHFHSNRLLLLLLHKITASSDIYFNFVFVLYLTIYEKMLMNCLIPMRLHSIEFTKDRAKV